MAEQVRLVGQNSRNVLPAAERSSPPPAVDFRLAGGAVGTMLPGRVHQVNQAGDQISGFHQRQQFGHPAVETEVDTMSPDGNRS